MRTRIELTLNEAGTILAQYYGGLLDIASEQIQISIDAPTFNQQQLDIGAVLTAIISPLASDPATKIPAIKKLRGLCPGMGLAEAKAAIEGWDNYLPACIRTKSLSPASAPRGSGAPGNNNPAS